MGYSDHTNNILTSVAAVCLGARLLRSTLQLTKVWPELITRPLQVQRVKRNDKIDKNSGNNTRKKRKKLQKSELDNLNITKKSNCKKIFHMEHYLMRITFTLKDQEVVSPISLLEINWKKSKEI